MVTQLQPDGERSDAALLATAYPALWADIVQALGPDPSWSPVIRWLLAQLDAARGRAMKVDHLEEMLRKVEWVRQSGGRAYACPFCHAVSEQFGGPGHLDDCEWKAACEREPDDAAAMDTREWEASEHDLPRNKQCAGRRR